ncbi:multisubunit potassium/proton antiporter PhaA subunit /multisubunit potassium/proton antiporter PhaB subunit [Panacagrimonas perspica]|uniref:Multisubunit potassium/proton antiporter PhaA subunit /multisubunit potassium/proton antiporter PhaB subunit n=1 Tax=Panacagrimonas perspica TaxID=381431 RepID=A0A4S3K3C1_9GAMM|nr:monovalent cation/H+ antiporter subunit A [Panacagrimonas perspica]TDU23295.1 multisubunit potassium/proton antiporter PhaA subunit /multisubunit potassium/proton antiporter PhaB subunit [Panacagrimonas perspica]THD02523.1 monovalent cation/H+ antiporter subunit A [Panacagrimonas perspica]
MSLFFLLLLPFLVGLVMAVMPTRARTSLAGGASLISAGLTAWLITLYPLVRDGQVIRQTVSWIPSIGLDLILRLDGFAWMFSVLITGIGALVALYARYYMSPADPVSRFYALFLLFMSAMLGVVTSGNLIQLVVFWELTSLISFLLIGYWHHRVDAQRGARMALIVTGAGGLALLGGVIVLGHIVGSFDLDVVLGSGDRVRAHPLYAPVLILVVLGALTKSAQFPFHFWLSRAMAAPTPVSAFLHSATMVKAGVFLLARLWSVLSGTELWFWVVGGAGAATLLLGSYIAMFQHDLKRVLAYSTMSHLGLITLLLGLNSPLAAVAGVFHIMNHAAFKASLFMAAGIVDHETGTRDIRRLTGLWSRMPYTGALALVASAAMAGVPLLNGFLSKEMFFAETVFMTSQPWVERGLPVLATLAAIFAVVYSLRFGYGIFFGSPATDLPREPEEAPRWMRAPIELLVLCCLIVGMAPSVSIGPALAVAALPVVGGVLPEYSLAVWHGFTAPLYMSLIAITVGIAAYVRIRRHQRRGHLQNAPVIERFNARRLFDLGLLWLTLWARRILKVLSPARLQPQMFAIIAIALLLALLAARDLPLAWGEREQLPASAAFVLLWAIGMACAIGAAMMAKFHRLVAITLMGGAGLVTCLTFAWFSAPDLALTQISVEVVTTTLFLLGLRWLPVRLEELGVVASARTRLRRARDLLLAIAAGTGLATLSYAMLTRSAPQSISPFFLERALPEGGGTNAVNVMLVDFRALDTLGEITVLGAVALTVYALLRRFRPAAESMLAPRQQRAVPADVGTDLVGPTTVEGVARGYMGVPTVIARLLLPVMLVVAAHLFLRGHNQPGGGFVAGLVIAIAMITQYIVSGSRFVEGRTRLLPGRWVAWGLLLATCTGLGAITLGYPLLTSHTAHFAVPLLGDVHFPTATFFDLGVLFVVVGATLLMLTAIAHQSLRAHRQPSVVAAPVAHVEAP